MHEKETSSAADRTLRMNALCADLTLAGRLFQARVALQPLEMLDRQVLIGEWTARLSVDALADLSEHPLQWSSELSQQSMVMPQRDRWIA